jgi:WD40 repeat protein
MPGRASVRVSQLLGQSSRQLHAHTHARSAVCQLAWWVGTHCASQLVDRPPPTLHAPAHPPAPLATTQVIFNPKDTNTFASASLDHSVKVWSLGQPMPNFTLEGHDKGVNCVDYFQGGDRPYLITGSDDKVRVCS